VWSSDPSSEAQMAQRGCVCVAIELSCSARKCCPCMVHISTATFGTEGCGRCSSDFRETSGMTCRNSSQGASNWSTVDRLKRVLLASEGSAAFSVVKAMSSRILVQARTSADWALDRGCGAPQQRIVHEVWTWGGEELRHHVIPPCELLQLGNCAPWQGLLQAHSGALRGVDL
jgi:hypothetical protein